MIRAFVVAFHYTPADLIGQKTKCRVRPDDASRLINFATAVAQVVSRCDATRMTAEDVIPTYARIGAIWAKQRSVTLMEKPWLDRCLVTAPRDEGRVRVLDLGCGAGRPIGTYLAERGAQITGVDATKTMTALYAENVQTAEVVTADMRGLTLDRRFDAIIAWNSFFHLSADDQRTMFATFAAHAAPGAALMFTSGHIAGEAIGQVAGAPIYHASLAPDDYRTLLAAAGFKVLHFTPEDPNCGAHTVWLAQYRRDSFVRSSDAKHRLVSNLGQGR